MLNPIEKINITTNKNSLFENVSFRISFLCGARVNFITYSKNINPIHMPIAALDMGKKKHNKQKKI